MVLDRPFWQACWSSKANATLTLILLALLLPAVWWAADWGIVQAVWRADLSACEAARGSGACWGVIAEKHRLKIGRAHV